jgi:hypothetical protein
VTPIFAISNCETKQRGSPVGILTEKESPLTSGGSTRLIGLSHIKSATLRSASDRNDYGFDASFGTRSSLNEASAPALTARDATSSFGIATKATKDVHEPNAPLVGKLFVWCWC